VLKLIQKTVKEENPQAVLIAEVFNFAPPFSNTVDGLQTYYLTGSIHSLLLGKISGRQFGFNLQQCLDNYDLDHMLSNFIMISSHDSVRALTTYEEDINKMKMALSLQFTLPGVPMTYYGDEIGMVGGEDPENRAPMIWEKEKWNLEILEHRKSLVNLRKERAEFTHGKTLELSQGSDSGVVAYLRYLPDHPDQFSLIVINPKEEELYFKLYIPYPYLFDQLKLENLFGDESLTTNMGSVDIKIKPLTSMVFIPNPHWMENYNFHKRVSPLK
jgi:glycosidase